MKPFVISLFICLAAVACQSDRVGPADQLYKTWKRLSGTYKGQLSPGESFFKDLLVEFKPDGQLLYGDTKQPGGCCRYNRFQLSGSTLRFSDMLSCPTVKCGPAEFTEKDAWQIETLTVTSLIIRTEEQRVVFEAQ